MKRESFIFYKSFYDSIKELAPKEQAQIYNAIFEYQFENKIIDLKGVCKSIFTLILPQLEANNKRYENGKRGGRPRQNQNETETKPKNNQNETKMKPNENDNVNENENDNVNENENDNVNENENDIYTYLENNFTRTLSPIEIDKISQWLSLYEENIIKYAIELSVLNGKKTFNYVEGILKNWKGKNYNTLDEILDNEKIKNNGEIKKVCEGGYQL